MVSQTNKQTKEQTNLDLPREWAHHGDKNEVTRASRLSAASSSRRGVGVEHGWMGHGLGWHLLLVSSHRSQVGMTPDRKWKFGG